MHQIKAAVFWHCEYATSTPFSQTSTTSIMHLPPSQHVPWAINSGDHYSGRLEEWQMSLYGSIWEFSGHSKGIRVYLLGTQMLWKKVRCVTGLAWNWCSQDVPSQKHLNKIQQLEHAKDGWKVRGKDGVGERRYLHKAKVYTGWSSHQKSHYISPQWILRSTLQKIIGDEAASTLNDLYIQILGKTGSATKPLS